MKLLLNLCFLLIVCVNDLFPQDSSNVVNGYVPRYLDENATFENQIVRDNSFVNFGVTPLNYYHLKNDITTGDNFIGFGGISLGYYYTYADGHYLNFSFSYDYLDGGNTLSGNHFDNVVYSKLSAVPIDPEKYYRRKDLTNYGFSLTENVVYSNLVFSFGLVYCISTYTFEYQSKDYGATWVEYLGESAYASLNPIIGVQYAFFNNFGVELMMHYSGKTFRERGYHRDRQLSMLLNINYRLPLQRKKVTFKDGEYKLTY